MEGVFSQTLPDPTGYLVAALEGAQHGIETSESRSLLHVIADIYDSLRYLQ